MKNHAFAASTGLSPGTDFWFQPTPIGRLQGVRRALCVVTAIYFLSAWSDVPTWFAADSPASSQRLSDFFRSAELTNDAAWMLSPLFAWDAMLAGTSLSESTLVYRLYLAAGILLAVLAGWSDVIAARFRSPTMKRLLVGSLPMVLLWVWFVGWANRVVLLAGTVEPVLSVSLATLAIAPIGHVGQKQSRSWRSRLSERLLGVQATLLALATTTTMIASPTWWSGTGAYALVAPVEDRFFDVRETVFEMALVYETINLLLIVLLPLGALFAWRPTSRKTGIAMVMVWAVLVGLLSANVLYAATLAIIATRIGSEDIVAASAGASKAETLDGKSIAGAA